MESIKEKQYFTIHYLLILALGFQIGTGISQPAAQIIEIYKFNLVCWKWLLSVEIKDQSKRKKKKKRKCEEQRMIYREGEAK